MEEEITCIVCFEPLDMNLGNVKTPCNHSYCMDCFIKHMRVSSECAMCRRKLTKDEPIEDDDETVDYNQDSINGHDIWPFELMLSNFGNFSSNIQQHYINPWEHPPPLNTPVVQEDINDTISIVNEMLTRDSGYHYTAEILATMYWPFMHQAENTNDEG